MKYKKRLLFGFLFALVASGLGPTAGATAGSLKATIQSNDPLRSSVMLKNTSQTPCQAIDTATGTVAITKVVQDGATVTPTPVDISFVEGLDHTLPQHLKTLKNGESLAVPLRATKSGDKVALRSIVWSPDGGIAALLYMVKPDRPVQLELNYTVPIDSPNDTPICGSVLASNIPAGPDWKALSIIGTAILIVIIVIALFFGWFLKRRKRRHTPIAAAAFVIGVVAVLAGFSSQPAHATVTVPDSVRSSWDSCTATLEANRDITGPVLDVINNPSVHIVIDPVESGGTAVGSPWPDGSYHLEWDLNDHHQYYGTGGFEDPCTALYHEFYHVFDMENRTFSREDCAGSGIETKEVMATRAQNALRVRLGMPARSHYGDRALPSGDCRAPSGGTCRGSNCARTTGDPHLLTFDGLRYDFQAAGEFVLLRAKNSDLQVQVRQEPWNDSRAVAINTAVVVKTPGGHIIQAEPKGYKLSLRIDGKSQPTQTMTLDETETTTVLNDSHVDIAAKDGSVITLAQLGNYGVDVIVDPAESLKGNLDGLMGNYDGNSKNELHIQSQKDTIEPKFSTLYPVFADSWRVTDKTSLFHYAQGKSTASYTNKAFPYEESDAKGLANYAAAEAFCKQMGVTEPTSLVDCAFDVALTGRPEFARSARQHQIITASKDDATTYTLQARNPGDTAKVTFTGKKNEKVFVDIVTSTFPSSCGIITIRDSANGELQSGCIINGKGYIETTTLPADGDYSLQLKAGDSATGDARAKLYRITDQTGNITPDGSSVTAMLTKPGMQAHFTFTATAGQRLFVSTSNVLLPSQCSPLAVLKPNGDMLSNGCVINNKGYIDTIITPESGTYTLAVNPSDITTGKLTLKLTTSQLIAKQLAIGQSTKLKFAKPGDEAEVSFVGVAGDKVYIEVYDSTLPSQCGGFGLKRPDGSTYDGCIIGKSDSLQSDGIVLPMSGVYKIYVNPTEANTGELSLRIRR